LNCLDNVAFSLKMRGVAKRNGINGRRVPEIGAHGRLRDAVPAQLSGVSSSAWLWRGTLITHPKVLLLDEPLSALDPFLRI